MRDCFSLYTGIMIDNSRLSVDADLCFLSCDRTGVEMDSDILRKLGEGLFVYCWRKLPYQKRTFGIKTRPNCETRRNVFSNT